MKQKDIWVYLDACCLNRPFDDLSQHRIRQESEAVLAILERCRSGQYQLLSSDAIDKEMSASSDIERQARVAALVSLATNRIETEDLIRSRAKELSEMGF